MTTRAPAFPVPDRSNFVPNQYLHEAEVDLGTSRGTLPDGREYLLEAWAQSGTKLVTVFCSTVGLDATDPAALLELVRPALEEVHVPAEYLRLSGRDVHVIRDARQQAVFSLTFVVALPAW